MLFIQVLKMKISPLPFQILASSLLCIMSISEVICSAGNGYVDEDLDFSDLETLDFTCMTHNDHNCNETRTNGDHLMRFNCICDHNCLLSGFCCLDSEFRPISRIPKPKIQVKCLPTYGITSRDVLMVDKCEKPGIINDLCTSNGENWNDLFLLIPVTSKVSNITYKNYYCAVCNENPDADQLTFWAVKLDGKFDLPEDPPVPTLTYHRGMKSWILKEDQNMDKPRNVSVAIEPLERWEVKYCRKNVVTECASNWTDTDVQDKCNAYASVFPVIREDGTKIRYKNPYCAVCNHEVLDRYGCTELLYYTLHFFSKKVRRFKIENEEKRCEDGAVYDIFSKKCRCKSEVPLTRGKKGTRNCVLRLSRF
ncbi:uncharacterized protein TNIN_201971 [Trichonephila inaurata madagascariensis]|uniref:SMB domain-containing protein n=1 Tax=Trichonephila inaurata madagascariensis TaxID=2747483 RepID=A0A8X6I9R5_9ARAC|nr:uncharacterized protein TNIN_201971 [Trichonephila inaurata madagascariensis]